MATKLVSASRRKRAQANFECDWSSYILPAWLPDKGESKLKEGCSSLWTCTGWCSQLLPGVVSICNKMTSDGCTGRGWRRFCFDNDCWQQITITPSKTIWCCSVIVGWCLFHKTPFEFLVATTSWRWFWSHLHVNPWPSIFEGCRRLRCWPLSWRFCLMSTRRGRQPLCTTWCTIIGELHESLGGWTWVANKCKVCIGNCLIVCKHLEWVVNYRQMGEKKFFLCRPLDSVYQCDYRCDRCGSKHDNI